MSEIVDFALQQSQDIRILEKKGWAGLIYRPWNKRVFEFSSETKRLQYFDINGHLRGSLQLAKGYDASIVNRTKADGKEFAFQVIAFRTFPRRRKLALERIILAAPTNNTRTHWISYLNNSIRSPTDCFVDDYFVVECIESFIRNGPGSLLKYDFAPGQHPTLFGFPGLTANRFWNLPRETALLETHFNDIRIEYGALRQAAVPISRDHRSIKNGGWSVYPLMERGVWHQENCALCPLTSSLLREIPLCFCTIGQVFFSMIPPHTTVSMHTGPTNTKLRIHLPILADGEASLQSGTEERTYREGEAIVFDSSFEHSVINNSDRDRVILLLDVWHPQLSHTAVSRLEAFFDPKRILAHSAYSQSLCRHPLPWLGIPAASKYRLRKPVQEGNKKVAIDFHFQLLVLGEPAAGKTNFVSRFAHRGFSSLYVPTPPRDVEFSTRIVRFKGFNIKVQLWDVGTANPYYLGLCQGFFICAFEGSNEWFDEVMKCYDSITTCAPRAPIVIVGTKRDLVAPVDADVERDRDRAGTICGSEAGWSSMTSSPAVSPSTALASVRSSLDDVTTTDCSEGEADVDGGLSGDPSEGDTHIHSPTFPSSSSSVGRSADSGCSAEGEEDGGETDEYDEYSSVGDGSVYGIDEEDGDGDEIDEQDITNQNRGNMAIHDNQSGGTGITITRGGGEGGSVGGMMGFGEAPPLQLKAAESKEKEISQATQASQTRIEVGGDLHLCPPSSPYTRVSSGSRVLTPSDPVDLHLPTTPKSLSLHDSTPFLSSLAPPLPPEALSWGMERRGQWLADQLDNVQYVECSSRESKGIDFAVTTLLNAVLESTRL